MVDLFLEPKVLNFHADRYELILLSLRWARTMKAKGSPEPMPVLIEKALRDLVEGKVTKEEIVATAPVEAKPAAESPVAMPVAGDGEAKAEKTAGADEKKTKAKTKAKAKAKAKKKK